MKTADLIPFILLELEESDKYGFELTKNIETKSNGEIIIKQPTLYTLLKKLEKSKFISSYWQDSEIGGKRHYYKLTENGRLQVSTLPSYEFLLKSALNQEVNETEVYQTHATSLSETHKEEKPLSIMDELLNQSLSATETILPTEEIFKDNNIDNATELDINLANTEVLKDESSSLDEQFAINKQVSSFTEKMPAVATSIIADDKKRQDNDILNTDFSAPHNDIDIKYVDYVDFKNSKENKYAKQVAHKKLMQVLATSGTLILLIAICAFVTNISGRSALYYVFFITSILIALFYPVLYVTTMQKFRLKCQNNTYKPKFKQRLLFGITLTLVVAIVSIIYSIHLGKNTVSTLLNFDNFANIYAPLLLCLIYFIDLLYAYHFVSKINK